MEVTHVQDHVTHAVIGGGKAESFGISDDPAFFHVLSSTLYSDKRRAVVRETMCNAWDAHIEAGITAMPIEVTLTSTKLIIQDFGSGIDKALIKPIYGVYGSSTKKKNKNVTGGFGLGCKAPFAYVDHFEVTSCHLGEKTIYRMSKSSGAVMGKPSILPILSVPTDETGITVSMEVKNAQDGIKFRQLIIQIAKLGGMKVKFNGELLESIPFHKAKNDYVVVKSADFGEGSEHALQIRYGNVVYPIERHGEYSDQYDKARGFLEKVSIARHYYGTTSGNPFGWVLILQAKPDTISVTPSRESLSMTDHTITTIRQLLGQFIGTTRGLKMKQVCIPIVKESISQLILTGKPQSLLTDERKIINHKAISQVSSEYITDARSAGGHYLIKQYPDWLYATDIKYRLNALVDSGFGKRGLTQSFRTACLKSMHKRVRHRHVTALSGDGRKWYMSRYVWPLLDAIQHEPLLDAKRLGIWGAVSRNSGYDVSSIIALNNFGSSFSSYLPLLRGVAIVAYNRSDIYDRASFFPMMKHWFGKIEGSLCYIVPRNKERATAAVAFLTRMGFQVVDLTKRHSWEGETVLEPVKKEVPAKKRLKGFPLLSGLGAMLRVEDLYSPTAIRSETPEFYAVIPPKLEKVTSLKGASRQFDESVAWRIIRTWGSKGVAVVSAAQIQRAEKMGAKDLHVWMREKLLYEYKNNPLVKEWHENSAYLDRHHEVEFGMDGYGNSYLQCILNDDELRKKVNLPSLPANEIQYLVYIYRQFTPWEADQYPELKEVSALVKTWGVNPDLKKVIDQIKASKMIRIISSSQIGAALCQGSTLTDAQKDSVRTIILTALRG